MSKKGKSKNTKLDKFLKELSTRPRHDNVKKVSGRPSWKKMTKQEAGRLGGLQKAANEKRRRLVNQKRMLQYVKSRKERDLKAANTLLDLRKIETAQTLLNLSKKK